MNDLDRHLLYAVERTQDSASATIVFASNPVTSQQIVVKILREYQDNRYDYSTFDKRQRCQLEALKWNDEFTPNFYFGLALICATHTQMIQEPKYICLENIQRNPKREDLLEEKEYGLIMPLLPEEYKLDFLLRTSYQVDESIPPYLSSLIKCISQKHAELPAALTSTGSGEWGDVTQLLEKLLENLAWLKIAQVSRPELRRMYRKLRIRLPAILQTELYQLHLKTRQVNECIKRCHGDLKAPNIWVKPDQQPEQSIWLLDTIDFNQAFCNIDTLSDFALLAVDVQARTDSQKLANHIIDYYLQLTGEERKSAEIVLAYYLVEKSIIGMLTSFLDDDDPILGKRYKKVVYQRLRELMNTVKRFEQFS